MFCCCMYALCVGMCRMCLRVCLSAAVSAAAATATALVRCVPDVRPRYKFVFVRAEVMRPLCVVVVRYSASECVAQCVVYYTCGDARCVRCARSSG